MELTGNPYKAGCAMRQGETLPQFFNSFAAHSVLLSLWHEVHGFGTPDCAVNAGVINRNVWLAT